MFHTFVYKDIREKVLFSCLDLWSHARKSRNTISCITAMYSVVYWMDIVKIVLAAIVVRILLWTFPEEIELKFIWMHCKIKFN